MTPGFAPKEILVLMDAQAGSRTARRQGLSLAKAFGDRLQNLAYSVPGAGLGLHLAENHAAIPRAMIGRNKTGASRTITR